MNVPSVCLSIHSSICISVVHPSIHPSTSLHPFIIHPPPSPIHLSTYTSSSIHLSIHPSSFIHLFIPPSLLFHFSIPLSISDSQIFCTFLLQVVNAGWLLRVCRVTNITNEQIDITPSSYKLK